MSGGKILVLGLVIPAALAGALMYWLQVYAFYDRLPATTPLQISTEDGARPLTLAAFDGIDASSSPLRFRACLRLAEPGELSAATPAAKPEPLIAPHWFDCFDARAIGTALEAGTATAYLAQHEIARGVDRIIAVFPDGRAYAWHQLNGTLE